MKYSIHSVTDWEDPTDDDGTYGGADGQDDIETIDDWE